MGTNYIMESMSQQQCSVFDARIEPSGDFDVNNPRLVSFETGGLALPAAGFILPTVLTSTKPACQETINDPI